MKKLYHIINYALIAIVVILDIIYMNVGGLWLKGLTSFGFVCIGLVNLIYAIKEKQSLKFPIILFAGLILGMLGDILLNIHFITGAIIFALGHVAYFIAYCVLQKFSCKDLIAGGIIFVPSVLIITLMPIFDFGGILMELVCVFYALIISLMLGKAVTNYVKTSSLINLLLVIGSGLFFFSDLMLLFDVFAEVPKIMGILCLVSYYPAQCIIAYSMLKYDNK